MKKFLCAIAVLAAFTASAFGYSSSELKRMSTFISNFTEVGMMNFEADDLSDSELAYFGVWHNWVNNFDSRIKRCTKKNCPYGSFTVDKKYVAESVLKYFDLELEHEDAARNGGHYDGKVYHFEGADGECVYARVNEAEKRGNIIIMRGETYYPDHEDIEGSRFVASARPYKYNGKNTWAIISLKAGD